MKENYDVEAVEPNYNPITLMDGSVIYGVCIPDTQVCEPIDNTFTLDTSGKYLSLKGKSRQVVEHSKEEHEEEFRLFCKNAAFFLHNRNAILHDSKLFLTPVPTHNGLAYTGTAGFRKPTLGVYVEWWINCKPAIFYQDDRYWLTCQFGGSPLSGSNSILASNIEGESCSFHSSDFATMWRSFSKINTRYDDAKQKYQSYTLREAIDILNKMAQPCDTSLSADLDFLFANRKIEGLYEFIDQQNKDIRHYRKQITELLIDKYRYEVITLCQKFTEATAHTQREIDQCYEQRAVLRKRLKDGEIDNKQYQKLYSPLYKREFGIRIIQKKLKRQLEKVAVSFGNVIDF